MADDHASAPRPEFDLDTDEGLSAYVEDLHTRRGIPESLRYPETPEAYERMLAEAEAEFDSGESYSLEEVRAHFAEWKARLR